jgi:hypothetical protein
MAKNAISSMSSQPGLQPLQTVAEAAEAVAEATALAAKTPTIRKKSHSDHLDNYRQII